MRLIASLAVLSTGNRVTCRWSIVGSAPCTSHPTPTPDRSGTSRAGSSSRPGPCTSDPSGLRKSFGDFEAVEGIDVDVRRGEAFGFLGPNGAGKSSTMRMIAAVSPVSGGELRILGLDPATDGPAIRGPARRLPAGGHPRQRAQRARQPLRLRPLLRHPARPRCATRADELLEFVQLTEKAKSKVEDLSGGMKRRLTIARSLINQPDLLLLDEPTTGLDPQARHLLWDRLFRLKQQGVTLVLTTHYMDEAEQLCDRLVVMDKGVIVAEGSPLELIREHSTREVAELRFGVGEHEALAEQGRRPRRAGRGAARPAAASTADDGEEVARQGARARAATRSRCWCAAPPWRTSSCASPAGRWWTDGDDRPDTADRRRCRGSAARASAARSTTGDGLPAHLAGPVDLVLRHAAVLRRWRWACCSAASSTADPGRARGRHVLPRLHRARAGRRPRDADRGRRDDLPGDGR